MLVLCKPVWVNKACQFFLVPSWSSSTPLYPSKVLRAREHASTSCSSVVFCLGFTFESYKELGAHQSSNHMLHNPWTSRMLINLSPNLVCVIDSNGVELAFKKPWKNYNTTQKWQCNFKVHYVSHQMNLVVQMFFSFHLMHQIKGLVQLFYQYFCKSLKRHLELIKVVDIIKTSRLKILKKKLYFV